jgi:glutamine synthetase adenylyltransferase
MNVTAWPLSTRFRLWIAGSGAPELQQEFRRIIERIQDKNEAFAEADKDRHHKREHMIAHENV